MLSDSRLKKLHRKESDSIQVFSDRDGLYLRVSKKGKLTFFIRYRYFDKPDQLSIGSYPEMSLKAARDKNEYYRAALLEGVNPKIKKSIDVSLVKDAKTFNDLCELWYEKEAKEIKKNHKQSIGLINTHVPDKMRMIPAESITTHHWLDLLEKIRIKTPHSAGILMTNIKQIYSFGIRRRILKENPLLGISAKKDLHINSTPGDRCLSDEEIRSVFKFIDGKKTRNSLIIHLLLFFGCRIGELRTAKISDFDFFNNVWVIPWENHKTGKRTKKPLTRPIIEEVKPIINELISMSYDGVNLITKDCGGVPKPSFHGMIIPTINNYLINANEEKIINWSIHDLRKTMRTNIASIAPPHICEIMLGHKLPGVWQTYDQYGYIDEQKKAYALWWHRLGEIIKNENKVSSIHQSAESSL